MKTLYRPVGEKEMILIAEQDYSKFPPRLDWQPIFYPVLNEAYACEIAEGWNTADAFGNYLGFVTRFQIRPEMFERYAVQNVGGAQHEELWVPAEELETFNQSIIGKIEIVKVFVSSEFRNTESKIIRSLIEKYAV